MENVLEIEHLSLSLPSKKGMIPILLHWSTYFGHKISKIRCQKIK